MAGTGIPANYLVFLVGALYGLISFSLGFGTGGLIEASYLSTSRSAATAAPPAATATSAPAAASPAGMAFVGFMSGFATGPANFRFRAFPN